MNYALLISLIGVLVVLTNIIVQVLKNAVWMKMPTNLLAVIVSMVLTVVVFFAYCQMNSITVLWYMVVAAIVVGFLVSYAAMFGFDKLKETLAQIEKK